MTPDLRSTQIFALILYAECNLDTLKKFSIFLLPPGICFQFNSRFYRLPINDETLHLQSIAFILIFYTILPRVIYALPDFLLLGPSLICRRLANPPWNYIENVDYRPQTVFNHESIVNHSSANILWLHICLSLDCNICCGRLNLLTVNPIDVAQGGQKLVVTAEWYFRRTSWSCCSKRVNKECQNTLWRQFLHQWRYAVGKDNKAAAASTFTNSPEKYENLWLFKHRFWGTRDLQRQTGGVMRNIGE